MFDYISICVGSLISGLIGTYIIICLMKSKIHKLVKIEIESQLATLHDWTLKDDN